MARSLEKIVGDGMCRANIDGGSYSGDQMRRRNIESAWRSQLLGWVGEPNEATEETDSDTGIMAAVGTDRKAVIADGCFYKERRSCGGP